MFKPAAPKYVLLVLSGLMWAVVGFILIRMVYFWLIADLTTSTFLLAASGLILGLLIHFFGFSRVVSKNLKRIAEKPERPCIFGFMSWKSYFLVILMMTLGISLRMSSIPKMYLSILYIGIGSALIFSGSRYFRMIFSSKKS